MKEFLYIDNDKIGEVDFKVIDESMGGIGGNLIANDNYKKYQSTIQQHFEKQGISNIGNFNFRILLEDNTELKPQGGIVLRTPQNLIKFMLNQPGLTYQYLDNTNNKNAL